MKINNNWGLIGNVGADPNFQTGTYGPMASISLAVTERYKDKNEAWAERTDWHRISFYGRLAEAVRDHVTKGRRLILAGEFRSRKRNVGGQEIQVTELVCKEFQFADGHRKESPGGLPSGSAQADPGGFTGASSTSADFPPDGMGEGRTPF